MAHPARAHVQIGWRAIFTTEHQIGSVPARAGERACFARVLLMPFEHTHEIARERQRAAAAIAALGLPAGAFWI